MQHTQEVRRYVFSINKSRYYFGIEFCFVIAYLLNIVLLQNIFVLFVYFFLSALNNVIYVSYSNNNNMECTHSPGGKTKQKN